MAIEKRCYPRVKISWPVIVVSDSSIISGRTENLSLVGTLVCCTEIPELLYNFRLVFRPAERQLLIVTAERVWSSTILSNDSMSHAMGVRFTYIPDHERRLFSKIIKDHFESDCENVCFEKISFRKLKCSQCKAKLLIRSSVKRCPVCENLLPSS